ncbi:hypothetical protein NLU13_1572 [Sarocladium strictum]|uniref:tRNA (adenine(58)-N(1))-methyltransferase catalytic subunit TRM61 n=1 Tax=Sarocladium strictum TaxID=5046 RepID=A0AA39LCM5_SARSR|nr:hypothetical protein NLU13_1572 [Sarocladium strictum]
MILAQVLRCWRFPASQRGFSSVSNPVIKENDVLLIRQEGSKYAKWHLTPPLRPGRRVKLSYGSVLHAEDLIGKNLMERLTDEGGRKIEVQMPSLAGYVVHSKRIATPIYPQDAATIVSLLDLHLTRPGEDEEDSSEEQATRTVDSTPFEIFEAGTGMGSLTLHIARAIHAANPPTPSSLRSALPNSFLLSSTTSQPDSQCTGPSSPALLGGLEESELTALQEYRSSRRAVIHTLDKNEKHIQEAYKFIRNFRRSQYLPSIDFYTSTTISDFLTTRLTANANQPFLSRAILDLPSAHSHAQPVLASLLPAGLLVVFAPSISQIAEFQKWCLETRQNARLERVIELPTTVASETMPDSGAGGRSWEVKVVRERGEGEWVQVMRPRVGDRVAGGGFIAVLRKMAERSEVVEDRGGAGEEFSSPEMGQSGFETLEEEETLSESVNVDVKAEGSEPKSP